MRAIAVGVVLLLGACAARVREDAMPDFLVSEVRQTRHEGADDLLSAGLGLAGLSAMPEAPSPRVVPDAATLRRRAIHSNWRGIADLVPGGSVVDVPNVPGREYSAFARVPGAKHPHRVLAQVPDAFDANARCLVVAPASGSRGVYGAIAVAGAWALPRGCAVVYTDKGAGTGFFDLDTREGVALDGTRAVSGRALLEFDPGEVAGAAAHRIATKHAHSQDNPEASWGEHVLQAARFGLHALDLAFPERAPFTAQNTTIIAAALSNGGGAVLHAAERDTDGLLDAVVAAAPQVTAPGARPLYDYASETALYAPCALALTPDAPALMPPAALDALATLRCASLKDEGLLVAMDPAAQRAEALARLRDGGWTDEALRMNSANVAFDLWRALVATYSSAYTRAAAAEQVCGYGFAVVDAKGAPRASEPYERALWWSESPGIAPAAGVVVVDANARGADATVPGLLCGRRLWTDDNALAQRLRTGVAQIMSRATPRTPFTLIVHGVDDGLVPIAFTTRPYVAAARANGARIALWEVARSQHFDSFLALPPLRARYRALLPFAHEALDRVWAMLYEGTAAPVDRVIE